MCVCSGVAVDLQAGSKRRVLGWERRLEPRLRAAECREARRAPLGSPLRHGASPGAGRQAFGWTGHRVNQPLGPLPFAAVCGFLDESLID